MMYSYLQGSSSLSQHNQYDYTHKNGDSEIVSLKFVLVLLKQLARTSSIKILNRSISFTAYSMQRNK